VVVFSRVVRFISRANRSNGMATRDGSVPALKFYPMYSPAAAPIGIHLRNIEKRKIAANSCVFSL